MFSDSLPHQLVSIFQYRYTFFDRWGAFYCFCFFQYSFKLISFKGAVTVVETERRTKLQKPPILCDVMIHHPKQERRYNTEWVGIVFNRKDLKFFTTFPVISTYIIHVIYFFYHPLLFFWTVTKQISKRCFQMSLLNTFPKT